MVGSADERAMSVADAKSRLLDLGKVMFWPEAILRNPLLRAVGLVAIGAVLGGACSRRSGRPKDQTLIVRILRAALRAAPLLVEIVAPWLGGQAARNDTADPAGAGDSCATR